MTEEDLTAARADLARRQAELLAALVAGGPVPPGFDERQVRAQSVGLASKRRDTTAKVAPELARSLGPRYGPLFLAYARRHPQTGGYRADARAFAEWVLGREGPATQGDPVPGELDTATRAAVELWLRGPVPRPRTPLGRLRRALSRDN